jgi:two-component system chemotaxis response regulator CheY|nr:response regulator [uncultured Rhodoferax sp.]
MTSTLLVVDDSKSSRKVNLALLRELVGDSAQYLEASGGQEALDLLAERSVDLVLLDLTMPVVSGFDVLAELQRRAFKAPVVVVSADIQKLAQERVAALGAAGFIAKPIQMDALRAALTQVGVLHV